MSLSFALLFITLSPLPLSWGDGVTILGAAAAERAVCRKACVSLVAAKGCRRALVAPLVRRSPTLVVFAGLVAFLGLLRIGSVRLTPKNCESAFFGRPKKVHYGQCATLS